MPNALLDDFVAEHHNHLLEAGNLKKSRTPWTDNHSWKTLGFSARISRSTCGCGTVTETLIGIFRDEETPSGARRSVATPHQEIHGEKHPVITILSQTPICAACLKASTYFRK